MVVILELIYRSFILTRPRLDLIHYQILRAHLIYNVLFLDFKSRHIALNEITYIHLIYTVCCVVIVRLLGRYTGTE